MKFQITHIMWMIGLLVLSTRSVSQVNPANEVFRDSLYQHISREMRAELSCRFTYEQGSSLISSYLSANISELNRLEQFIHQALSHPNYSVKHICITGYSSIEGDYNHNGTLARERAEYFQFYLSERYPELYRYPHNVAWVAEDWQGLGALVRASNLNEREEVLEIIRKIRVYDEREMLLLRLNGGQAYRIMEATMFPQLRRVELQIEYQLASLSTTEATPPPSTVSPFIDSTLDKDTVNFQDNRSLALAQTKAKVASCTTTAPRFAIKTNLLLWAGIQHDFKYTTPVANVALEYYVNDNWSVEIGAMYSYWRYDSNRKFQGISGYRLEPRYSYPVVSGGWIKGYLGLYGRVGDYDRSFTPSRLTPNSLTPALSQGEGEGNYTGDYWDAGLSAGVTFQLVDGFGLEVGARAGYVHTNAIRYTKDGEYNWYHSRKAYNKFNVTDLNVSLIYRFR